MVAFCLTTTSLTAASRRHGAAHVVQAAWCCCQGCHGYAGASAVNAAQPHVTKDTRAEAF